MKINVSTPSTNRVLTLAEAKDHLRYDAEDEDAYLTAILLTETDRAEKVTNRALLTQTIDIYRDAWPQRFNLPRPPVQSVTSITFRPTGSTAYSGTASTSTYTVSTVGMTPFVELKNEASWPSDTLARTNPIRIRYVAGYGARGSDVPEGIRMAILLRAADRFENREDTLGPQGNRFSSHAADALLAHYKVSVAS